MMSHELKVFFVALAVLLAGGAEIRAQNRVLELDGQGAHVELPIALFSELEDATVEGWVKWHSLAEWSRFFDFGRPFAAISISQLGSGQDLQLENWSSTPTHGHKRIVAAKAIITNQWVHLAAVFGRRGMEFYFNGVLVGTAGTSHSFHGIGDPEHCFLGADIWKRGRFFHGQMDEIRLWRTRRTAEELRENMFRSLSGNEANLVGVWNFDSGDAASGTGRGNGAMRNGARAVAAPPPDPWSVARPAVIYGSLKTSSRSTLVEVFQDRRVIARALDEAEGFRVGPLPVETPLDLRAINPNGEEWRTGIRLGGGEERQIQLGLTNAFETTASRIAYVAALMEAAPTHLEAEGVLRQYETPHPWSALEKRRKPFYVLTGVICAVALLHLLLFAFYPEASVNLWHALYTGTVGAAFMYAGWHNLEFTRMDEGLIIAMGGLILMLGLKLQYALFYDRTPKHFWVCVAAGAPIGLLAWPYLAPGFPISRFVNAQKDPLIFWAGIFFLFTLAEAVRVNIHGLREKKPGSRTLGVGLLVLLAAPFLGLILNAPGSRAGQAFALLFYQWIGVTCWVCCISLHLAQSFGRIHHALAVATEEARRAREAAEAARASADEANLAKSRFLASMSHELRTPLNAIIGYSEMVTEELHERGVQDVISDLHKVQSAARHQLGLVNDILDLAKVEAGKMSLHVEEFAVSQLISEVAATAQPLVARKHNKLTVECPEDIGQMRSDQIKLRQVLLNLLSNAAKFTENGEIKLQVSRNRQSRGEQTIRFRVSDTGMGMSEEQVSRLFQPFSQADATIQAKYGGTGLGLALSRNFCEMMGGKIVVESVMGKGSTFTLTLPADLRPQEQVRM